jgi:carboxyl-terminal processing protease
MLNYGYVDNVLLDPIVEKGIISMLKELDPHSSYIAGKDREKSNEQLQGNFDGIGVAFQIINDTIVVVEAISGGPSEKLGIQSGDKIVRIDTINATGTNANNDFVFSHLRGVKGTVVTVGIIRTNVKDLLIFNITRDKIPIHSVETYFMENKNTGYIQVERFSRNTSDEFHNAVLELKKQGAKNLIIDLRGNGGGYMDQAVKLADEFLKNSEMVVYMEGQAQPRQNNFATDYGDFNEGKVVVLIDEHSASASEIVSGALQDHDRAIIVGRRSFGKGLVQRPMILPDDSELRLTIARYYTPSGRFIQKPYNDGLEAYYSNIMNRSKHGEMLHPDSVKIADTLKFFTDSKRVVYGGGGIMPDIFTPIDTNRVSDYYVNLRRVNALNNFVMNYLDKNRNNLQNKYANFESFNAGFNENDTDFRTEFFHFAEKAGVKPVSFRKEFAENMLRKMLEEMKADSSINADNYVEYTQKVLWTQEKMKNYLDNLAKEEDVRQAKLQEKSEYYIFLTLKALLARNLYGTKSYFQTMKVIDDAYQTAVSVISNEKLFKKNKIRF